MELDAFEQAIQSQVPSFQFTPAGWSPSPTSCFSRSWDLNVKVIGKHHSALCFPEDVKTRDYEGLWQDLRGGVSRSGRFIRQSKSGKAVAGSDLFPHRHRRQGGADRQGRLGRDPAAILPGAHPGPAGWLDKSLAVIDFQPDGTVLNANQNFLHCFGYRLEEGGRQTPSPLLRPRVLPENPNFWHDLGSGTSSPASSCAWATVARRSGWKPPTTPSSTTRARWSKSSSWRATSPSG